MNGRVLLRLVSQLVFGWDTVTGIAAFVLLSFIFREPANPWFLIWAGFCAYLPDLDLIHFLFMSTEVRKWGHWRLGFHHPMFFLAIAGLVGWQVSAWLFPGHAAFFVALTIVPVFGHFVHDSTIIGLHWFSPFTKDGGISLDPHKWAHIMITRHGLHIMTPEEVKEVYEDIARKSKSGDRGGEIATRIEPVTPDQVACFITGVLGIVALVLNLGYASVWQV